MLTTIRKRELEKMLISNNLAELKKIARKGKNYEKEYLAKSELCPAKILDILIDSDETYVVLYAAENKNLSIDSIQRVLSDKEYIFKEYFLKREDCPLEFLKIYADNPKFNLRGAVAKHPKITIDMMERFSKDQDERVRQCLASNTNCPANIIEQLLYDECGLVRILASENRNITPEIMIEKVKGIGDDGNFLSIYKNFLDNPICPEEIKGILKQRKYIF